MKLRPQNPVQSGGILGINLGHVTQCRGWSVTLLVTKMSGSNQIRTIQVINMHEPTKTSTISNQIKPTRHE